MKFKFSLETIYRLSAERTDCGKLFHAFGPAIENELSPSLIHSSSGRQPNFPALNRGRHLYSAGRPSRWALAHISSYGIMW